jgi:hypothetical protein
MNAIIKVKCNNGTVIEKIKKIASDAKSELTIESYPESSLEVKPEFTIENIGVEIVKRTRFVQMSLERQIHFPGGISGNTDFFDGIPEGEDLSGINTVWSDCTGSINDLCNPWEYESIDAETVMALFDSEVLKIFKKNGVVFRWYMGGMIFNEYEDWTIENPPKLLIFGSNYDT